MDDEKTICWAVVFLMTINTALWLVIGFAADRIDSLEQQIAQLEGPQDATTTQDDATSD